MVGNNSSQRLLSIITKVEQLHSEREAIGGLISDTFKEAKDEGFDARILKKIIAERRKDEAKRNEEWELFASYWNEIHQGDLFAEAAE